MSCIDYFAKLEVCSLLTGGLIQRIEDSWIKVLITPNSIYLKKEVAMKKIISENFGRSLRDSATAKHNKGVNLGRL